MYIIYNQKTTMLVHGIPGKKRDYTEKSFATMGAAKAFLTRMVKAGAVRSDYGIADAMTFYNEIEKTETVVNLMSGKPVVQRVNTPLCCDPSSETYWSM
jgi:hypothetical protein